MHEAERAVASRGDRYSKPSRDRSTALDVRLALQASQNARTERLVRGHQWPRRTARRVPREPQQRGARSTVALPDWVAFPTRTNRETGTVLDYLPTGSRSA